MPGSDAPAPLPPTLDRKLVCAGGLEWAESGGLNRVEAPPAALLDLPEKAVHFGTGALARGLVADLLDAANRAGIFGGRMVVIAPPGEELPDAYQRQGGLFTLRASHLDFDSSTHRTRIVASISRALSAGEQWAEVAGCARDPAIELVFTDSSGVERPPVAGGGSGDARSTSIDGLARFLLERAQAFDFDPGRGVTVIPCEPELVESNGAALRQVILDHATGPAWPERFAPWLRTAVVFCDTVVDRMVAAPRTDEARKRWLRLLGYRDELAINAEPYRLLAIAAPGGEPPHRLGFLTARPGFFTDDTEDARLAAALSEAGLAAEVGVVLVADLAEHRERRLRVVDGLQTVLAHLGLLSGSTTVADLADSVLITAFMRRVYDEIARTFPAGKAGGKLAVTRLENRVDHRLLVPLATPATARLRRSIVPSIERFLARTGRAPQALAVGFAAYILVARGDVAVGKAELPSLPPDQGDERVQAAWRSHGSDLAAVARAVCGDRELWGIDLTEVDDFASIVASSLTRMVEDAVVAPLAIAIMPWSKRR